MKINSILKEVLERAEPLDEEKKFIEGSLNIFLNKLNKKIEKLKDSPEIFIGGSYAKKTLIKKDKYDIDVFLRFGREYEKENLSKITEKLLKDFKNVLVVHGSRDYFRIKIKDNLFIELIPVKKVRSPDKSENITDLSYSHVRYINKKVKSDKILEDIKIAKAFCHANNCYGAESYIQGFSGYSLELLVYYYKSFLKMIKELSKPVKNNEKILIDIEKDYKIKKNILIDMNSSKLESPVILVDPTYKQRNVLAALSKETFERFQKACRNFLKYPSIKSFEKQKVDLQKTKKDALKNKNEFLLIEISTNKQEGDIAGSKLLKFYKHFSKELSRFFEIKKQGFNYNGKKSARVFFVVKSQKEIIFNGPFKDDLKNVSKFKKEHKNIFEKKGKMFAHEKINFSGREFFNKWKLKNKKKIKEMNVGGLKFVN